MGTPKPILTTLTPYWDRENVLRVFLKALSGASHPRVRHLIMVPGIKKPLSSLPNYVKWALFSGIKPGTVSIGWFHNIGAEFFGETEWIMKLDVDAIPNNNYFHSLIPILEKAGPREWFNGGMIYADEATSKMYLGELDMPIDTCKYNLLKDHIAGPPRATNFICRRKDYLALGGCDDRFRGHSWEDYQQIYMLEHYQRGKDPLPGPITLKNVTQRCRDEISKPKALELYKRDTMLSLIHRWHPVNRVPPYHDPAQKERNRQLLFEYITKKRDEKITRS